MTVLTTVHPHRTEEVEVHTAQTTHGSAWVEIHVGDMELTIFARSREHLQEILHALANPADLFATPEEG